MNVAEVRYRPDAGCVALGRCVRTLRLEQLTDLGLAHGTVLAGVDERALRVPELSGNRRHSGSARTGYPKTVVPGKKLPGRRLVGGLPRTDLHHINVAAKGKGVIGLPAGDLQYMRQLAIPPTGRSGRSPRARRCINMRFG